MRLDSGNDSLDNLKVCHNHADVDYIIKVNLRKTPKTAWLAIAKEKGIACEQLEWKTEYVGAIEFPCKGFDFKLRQVFHVTQRTMDSEWTSAAPSRTRGARVLGLRCALRLDASLNFTGITALASNFTAN